MNDYKELHKQLNSLTTIDEFRQVKSFCNDKIKEVMRTETNERLIKEYEEKLELMKAQHAHNEKVNPHTEDIQKYKDIQEYNDSLSLKEEQIVNIINDVANKKKM